MARQQNLQRNRAGWAGLISVTLLGVCPMATLAQVAGDGSLGTQVNGSAIAPCIGTCIITDGATRGSNLFHSFRQFSLPNGDFAGFVTTPAIQNVIVRVTGAGQPFTSNINGTIATSNPANFFLLNPNGIIFGPGARLDVGGAFLATTAERMQFQDGTLLSTRDPTPLLTISVPTGLQMGQTPGEIRSQLQIGAGINSSFTNFAFVGGDVILDNSLIQAPGQRIEFMGVGDNGSVGLQLIGDRLSLSLTANTPRQDITLTNGSTISTQTSNGGGEVIVTGRNIVFSESGILVGILPGVNNAATNRTGDITVDAAASLQFTQGSFIANLVQANAIGQGGNLNIIASDIQVRDSSAIGTTTRGNGNAGNVRVTANTIALDRSGIISGVDSTGSGRSGNITVETGSLVVTNGAAVSASTFGNGNGGSVQVTANTIVLDGITPNGQAPSGIASEVGPIGNGRGGDVTIEADSLTITNGAAVSASTFGIGGGGDVRVTANTIALDGSSASNGLGSGIVSQVFETGSGDGGNVTVETGSLTITNHAVISAGALGTGNGGNVQVTANTITLDEAGIVSQVFETGSGRGGDITVETGSLTITNGGQVSAGTAGNGNGGNVRVTANSITLDGTTPNGQSASGINSEVAPTARGRGGDVSVEANSLSVTNGAVVSASTFGNGDGGNVQVLANTIALDGTTPNGQFSSGISSIVTPPGRGRGGDITIATSTLAVTNNAVVSASNLSSGSAGNLDITAQTIRLDRSNITARAVSGDGANITLNVRDLLLLRNNSLISTSAGTAQAGGNGGDITITTPFIVGVLNEDSDIAANAFTGRGGNITINTNAIYGLQFQPQLTPLSDITASSQFGISGIVALNTLNLDPSRGLVALPVALTDPSQQISQGCTPSSGTSASSFVATGRGGIPSSPDEPLESRAVVTKWIPLPEDVGERGRRGEGERGRREQSETSSAKSQNLATIPTPIVEAQGIIVGVNGVVELVAPAPTMNPTHIWAAACRGLPGN